MIKKRFGRNITVPSKTELDNDRFEYDEIVNVSEISNGDEIYDVWNQLDDGIGKKKRRRKSNKTFLNDDDIRLMVSRKSSNERKHDFPNHQQKINASLNLCHEEHTKNLIIFWLIKNQNRGMIMNPAQLLLKKSLTINLLT